MKQTNRFQIFQIMFWGHFILLLYISGLTLLKGFDVEEYRIVYWTTYAFMCLHGYRLAKEVNQVWFSSEVKIFGFQKTAIISFFAFMKIAISVKALDPATLNFKEMMVTLLVLELLLHILVFFVHIGAKSQMSHRQMESG